MSSPSIQNVLRSIWSEGPSVTTPQAGIPVGEEEVDVLSVDECLELNGALLESMRDRVAHIREEEMPDPLKTHLATVKFLIEREASGMVFDTDFVAARDACRVVVERGEGPTSVTFKSIDKALAIFARVKERIGALGIGDHSQSRSSSNGQKKTPSENDLAPIAAEEFGVEPIPPHILSSLAFSDLVMEAIRSHDCIVFGDGCHQDAALGQILSTPSLAQRLREHGLTYVVIEHVYPQHIEMIRVNRVGGVRRLEEHFLRNTFPVLTSPPSGPSCFKRRRTKKARVRCIPTTTNKGLCWFYPGLL